MRISGHWPEFAAPLCGVVDDRRRLGLPDHYVADQFSAQLPDTMDELRGQPRAQLLALVQSPAATLLQRLAAGHLLAWLGDPRIDTLAPPMCEIGAASVSIGLAPAEVAGVMQRFARLGLQEDWIRKECPRHRVQLAPYRIGRYPVTNQEYRDFLLATGYPELPSSWQFRRYPLERANHPVYTLSVAACLAYTAWLSAQTGRSFRLPGEAEWEYAAAGADGREFPWGEQFDPACANTCETGLFDASPVGVFIKGRAWCGALDMAGNVEEYVADQYAPYPGGAQIDDHLVQLNGSYHVARGGSFARFRDLARCQRRHGHNPRSATYAMGFRLAESI